MNRKPVVQSIPSFDGREIVMSDLHGNLLLYNRLLAKAHYRPGLDRLILLGDLCEKGPASLELVRQIMKQKAWHELIYCVMGNCDFVAKNILYSYRLEFLRSVLLNRNHSLIHEMMQELGLPPLDAHTDMEELAQLLRRHFLAELSFINDLPHVLESEERIYTHAGIQREDHFGDDFRENMTDFQFARRDQHFQKTVLCGHMPVSEYCHRIACFLPILDREKNIFSLDGGNQVNEAGQLNALIFDQSTLQVIWEDLLPETIVIKSWKPSCKTPFYIGFNNRNVRILEKSKFQTKVFSEALHRSFWIPDSFLLGNSAAGFTNYLLSAKAGDRVKVVRVGDRYTLCKKNGILGWIESDCLKSEDSL